MKKTTKKPCGKACKKSCGKTCEKKKTVDASLADKPTLNRILGEIVEDNRRKLNLYSDAAVKAGEVLKFLLQLVKESKESYDNLSKMLGNVAVPGGVKVEKVDLADKGIEVRGRQTSPFSETLFKVMLDRSKYDFSGFDVEYRRVPKFDTKTTLAFEFRISRKAETKDGITTVTQDNAIVHASANMNDSVAAFDEVVGHLFTNVPLKKDDQKCEKTGKCDHPCKEQGKAGRCPISKTITLKPKVKPCNRKPVVPVIDDLKKTVLECSKYAVPSSRVRFVAFRVDVKHQNLVYEIRFYQKSTKSVPVDKQSYEPAYLNVRMHGDRDDLLARRFDKIVENLRFNEFPEKK